MKTTDSAGRCARHKYYHLLRRYCSNASTIKKGIYAAIILRSESGEDIPQASSNTSSPRAQLPKVTKRHRINTTSPTKKGKFNAQTIAEINDTLGADEGGQIILSQGNRQ